MKLSSFKIKPNEGYGNILFGEKLEDFIARFGEPEDLENFEDDEDLITTVLHYWQLGISFFFMGLSTLKLAGIETDIPKTKLFGKKIIGLTEKEFIAFMKENGLDSCESETEFEDRRLSYDLGMMDFFFRDDKLVYMNFGVMMDDQGNIEIPE